MTGESRQDESNSPGESAPALCEALAEAVTELHGSDPALDFDVASLREVFSGRRVVGFGEATHGTREFFQLKHRFVRFLVEELDVRLFGLEANFTETLAIDAYIRNGDGNLEDALEGIYFWTWRTEEVAALIEWLRSFNRGREPDDKVRFYGFDAQFTAGPAEALEEYLATADPDYLTEIEDDLEALDDEGLHASDEEVFERRMRAADSIVERVGERLRERKSEYVSETSGRAWALARQHLRTLEQARDGKRAQHAGEHETKMFGRDRAMARNVEWILDHESADQIALWAHNAHVNREEVHGVGETAASMGHHLAERYGDAYCAVGFVFGRGRFQAIAKPTENNEISEYELTEHTLDSPRANTVGDAFASLDIPAAFLNVDSATDDRLVEWLGQEQRFRSIGATYDPASPEEYFRSYVPATAFDSLCYVEEGSRAQPL
jgi:erythromycin esterase